MTDVDVDPTDKTPLIPHTDDGDDDDTFTSGLVQTLPTCPLLNQLPVWWVMC